MSLPYTKANIKGLDKKRTVRYNPTTSWAQYLYKGTWYTGSLKEGTFQSDKLMNILNSSKISGIDEAIPVRKSIVKNIKIPSNLSTEEHNRRFNIKYGLTGKVYKDSDYIVYGE